MSDSRIASLYISYMLCTVILSFPVVFVARVSSMQSPQSIQTLLGEQTVPALLGVHWFRLKSDILWGKVRQSQTIGTKSSDYYISKVGNTGLDSADQMHARADYLQIVHKRFAPAVWGRASC